MTAPVPFAIALALLAAGCNWPPTGSGSSSSGGGGTATVPKTDPPVIQSLDMPAAVTPTGAFYVVQGSITFTDDDDVIVSGGVYIPVIGKTIPVTIPPEDQQSNGYGTPFAFQVSDDVPLGGAGPTTYIVTLTNKSGAVSTGWQGSVDLQP